MAGVSSNVWGQQDHPEFETGRPLDASTNIEPGKKNFQRERNGQLEMNTASIVCVDSGFGSRLNLTSHF